MDQLEKYIEQHRRHFDDANPDPRIWEAIESKLPQREAKRFTLWKVTAVAAVALVFILSGVIAGLQMQRDTGFTETAEYIEFREAERYYDDLLQQRVNALAEYNYDQDINSDLEELKDVYNELTTELEDGLQPNKNDIIQALIQNYQTRISLLERVLEKMEESQGQLQITEDDENTKI